MVHCPTKPCWEAHLPGPVGVRRPLAATLRILAKQQGWLSSAGCVRPVRMPSVSSLSSPARPWKLISAHWWPMPSQGRSRHAMQSFHSLHRSFVLCAGGGLRGSITTTRSLETLCAHCQRTRSWLKLVAVALVLALWQGAAARTAKGPCTEAMEALT